MKKIAIVVQRFGDTVNGGAEVHAQQIAQLLKDEYSVTVVTSCAENYTTWEATFPEGTTKFENIDIVRLNNHTRNPKNQKKLEKKIKYNPKVYLQRKFYTFLKPNLFSTHSPQLLEQCKSWSINQGPYIPELESWISNNQHQYSAFIFFSAIYYPTAVCMKKIAKKSILVPLLHNETCSFFPLLNDCYKFAEFIFFNTKSEKKLAESIYNYDISKGSIVAVGVDSKITTTILENQKPYIIYIGRISKEKGCEELIKWFIQWNKTNTNLQLYFVGKATMEIPDHPNIIYKGFVSEEEKNLLLKNAQSLVIPSKHESLSLVTLESFQLEVPVIGNYECETIRDHIIDSQAGFLYTNYKTFSDALNKIYANTSLKESMGTLGKKYVEQQYNWSSVKKNYISAIEQLHITCTQSV